MARAPVRRMPFRPAGDDRQIDAAGKLLNERIGIGSPSKSDESNIA